MNTACKDGLTPEKESDLGALRAQLDRIDAELQTLFERRMALCGQIGDYKKARGLPILDAEREREKLDAVEKQNPEAFRGELRGIFRAILAESRALQQRRSEKPKLRQAASAFLRLSLGCQYGRFVVY